MATDTQSQVSHTPGPWAVKFGQVNRTDSSTIYKADDRDFLISHVICEGFNKEQRAVDIANARLMAAAPELLAALEILEADMEMAYRDGNGDMDHDGLEKARAAIAKATGATP